MRLFYALPAPSAAVQPLGRVTAELRKRFSGLSVSHEAGLHFTLFFFGEVGRDAAARLSAVLDAAELARPPWKIRFSVIGAFPPEGNPRVIYAGLEEGGSEVTDLRNSLGRLLEREGLPLPDENRPFHPHLTLARNKRGRLSSHELKSIALPSESFFIDRCVLFQSLLKPSGAVYIPLKERFFIS